MEPVETLPAMLRRLRGEMSTRSLASALLVSHSTIVRWESGASVPTLPALRRLLTTCEATIRESLHAEALWYEAQATRGSY
jgi:DNA-binding transcriptional regulator YiaG